MSNGDDYQDAYVFVASGSGATLAALDSMWRDGTIRFVARLLSGKFGALAFLEAPPGDEGLSILRDRLSAVEDQVGPGSSVGLSAYTITPMAPTHWLPKSRFLAYVRIRAESGQVDAVAAKLREALGEVDGAAALVIGDWDLLAEVGATSLAALKERVKRINSISGTAWTDTAIVLNDTGEAAPPAR